MFNDPPVEICRWIFYLTRVKEHLQHHIKVLSKLLEKQNIKTHVSANHLLFSSGDNEISFSIAGPDFDFENSDQSIFHLDQLVLSPEKMAGIVLSKLKLNKSVFARKCEVKKIGKPAAEEFLEKYHLWGSTSSGSNYGLFLKDDLLAVASFSKGRKMNRLKEDQRSFELIRFCCRPGITITGGLTKLVKNFCEEKKAGDVMTYVDKQLSDGRSFISAGFKKHSETEPNFFLVNKKTYERTPAKKEEVTDEAKFYLSRNGGSIKLVYTPHE